MRIDIHLHHHNEDTDMSKLTDAVEALATEVAESNGKLASIQAYLEGVPDLVATAVAEALEANNVEAEAAAAAVDAARQAISDGVDATLAGIEANPVPEE